MRPGGPGDMQPPRLIGVREIGAITAVWVMVFVVVGFTTGRISVHSFGGTHRPWRWPWLHWCIFDRECQEEGNPARIYVHLFGFYVDFQIPGRHDLQSVVNAPEETV